MSVKIKFWGGAGTVTGSMHLIKTDQSAILLDGGLFQGRRKEFYKVNTQFPCDLSSVNSLVLSHAHIDHSGNIPTLTKHGFNAPIYTTTATVELCQFMLLDSGHIQEEDIKFLNKIKRRKNQPLQSPLYTKNDAQAALTHFRGVDYRQSFKLTDDINCTLYDAGHVLGAAITVLDIKDESRNIRVAYAVDLGRENLPLLKDPETVANIDYLIIESTYGNREHDSIGNAKGKLAEVINRTSQRGGKIIIPSFAFERTQEIVYFLNELLREKKIPDLPIFVDSPLAVNITEVFQHNHKYLDQKTRDLIKEHLDPFGFHRIKYLRDVEDSKRLHGDRRPMIIISASGMCEAGRILHHLKNNIENPANTIMIVGYMAQHTLGKKIVDRQPQVRIFGEEYQLRAEVVKMNSFSAHADKNELLKYVRQSGQSILRPLEQSDLRPSIVGSNLLKQNCRTIKRIFVVHGDVEQSIPFVERLNQLKYRAYLPQKGEEVSLGGE